MPRQDGRLPDQIRPLTLKRQFTRASPGSVLVQCGRTLVLCTASVSDRVPAWLEGTARGWITAEYGMLPGSTRPRKPRERGSGADGRSTEIQRLVGRSLRAITDLTALGTRTITVDCDVLDADGGTRTASVTGALVALVDAVRSIEALPDPNRFPLRDSVAAVSVGLVDGHTLLDLDYQEDLAASVDLNVVMTGAGRLVEVQGAGEEATFTERQLSAMLRLARKGTDAIRRQEQKVLGRHWPFAYDA
ncbi:MAG: ribonuclease PH [Planctomycetes bacterium RBG_16_64_10]|nr:MAG: ribonuclease PH [Planctomycetes bacterium RBG_16_64_10]